MANIRQKSDDSPACENDLGTFNPEFATELSNKLERVSPRNDGVSTIDMYEERLHEMTASYSEISFDSVASLPDGSLYENRSLGASPGSYDLECSIKRKNGIGTMKSEEGIQDCDSRRPDKLELQNYPRGGTDVGSLHKALDTPPFPGSRISTPCLYRQALMPQLPSINQTVLNDLEVEVRKIATSVDTLTENLAGILHSVSALTVDCLEIYRDAVCKTCDAVDSNIKSMYQLMAKCEELSKSMKPIYKLAEQIKGIKRLLDLFENAVST